MDKFLIGSLKFKRASFPQFLFKCLEPETLHFFSGEHLFLIVCLGGWANSFERATFFPTVIFSDCKNGN